ncbi:MAG: PilZ domain-containing protein [Tissierellia bacterium]|nr:PilZ domain-containing protein [Tissierellia bacterium]
MSMFELNAKIELLDEDGNKTYGLVHDYVDGKLYVSTTPDEIDLKIFRINDKVRGVTFKGSKGTSFDGVVTNRTSDKLLIYEISKIGNFTEVQRREDVRVTCSMPLYFTNNPGVLKMDSSFLYENIEDLKEISDRAIVSDLSAGGMKFNTKERLEANDEVRLLFYIEKKPFILKGKILHKMINIVRSSTNYSYGTKFIDITESEREAIISYLFVLMRKNRIR